MNEEVEDYQDVYDYASLLGKKGLAEYRKLAEAEWAKLPPLQSGRRDVDGYGSRYRITHLMETLVKESGDMEALVAIQKRDPSSSWAYLRIAEAYKEKGKYDAALEWAEAGRKAFPKDAGSRLLEFLADEWPLTSADSTAGPSAPRPDSGQKLIRSL